MISRQFRLQAQLTETDFVNNKSIQSILPVRNSPNIEFLLGILNSHLISWFFLQKSNVGRRDDFPKIVLKETRLLPFCAIEPSNEKGISLANNISALVKDLNKVISRWSATTAPPAKENFHRQIEMLDKEIDRLVYKLYGLTEEEIKIVEEST